MSEYDDVPPQYAANMRRQRQPDLLDHMLGEAKYVAAVVDHRCQHLPDDETDSEKGQVAGEVLIEYFGVQESHRRNHDRGADRQPEWSEHRAAVTSPDIVPTEQSPHMYRGNAGHNVLRGMRERSGCSQSGVDSLWCLGHRSLCLKQVPPWNYREVF